MATDRMLDSGRCWGQFIRDPSDRKTAPAVSAGVTLFINLASRDDLPATREDENKSGA